MLTKSSQKNHPTPGQSADSDGGGGEFYHDEPPDGKGEGEPDGDGVDHDGEVCVEQEEHRPRLGKLKCATIEILSGWGKIVPHQT